MSFAVMYTKKARASVKSGSEACVHGENLDERRLFRFLLCIAGDLSAVILVVCCFFMLVGDSAMSFDMNNSSGGYETLGLMIVTGFLAVALRIFMGWNTITSRICASATTTPIPNKAQTLEKILSESHDYADKTLPKGVEVINECIHATAHDSYVVQSGPVCAAASVAGALNIIFNYKTDNEKVRKLSAAMFNMTV
jgi:hypothetical protein